MNKKLIDLRKESGLTQKALGEKLQCTDKSIWAYEHGIATPSNEVLVRYAEYFGVTTDYLLGMNNDFSSREDSVPAINRQERLLLEKYRKLTDKDKNFIKSTIDFLSKR